MESGRRHEIGKKIVALGGTHYTDLMSSVQYLVVGKRNTEKYRYSIRYRHDMVFLTEEAVSDIYSRWVAGHDLGLTLDSHLLPVFSNFTVCVARVEKPPSQDLVKLLGEKFRNPPSGSFKLDPKDAFKADKIIEVMTLLGANVSTTLTPNCDVLVSTDTAGRRYTIANEWKIPAVHPLWVFDSCLRGATLNLDDYVVSREVGNLYNNGSFVWKKLYCSQPEIKKKGKEVEKREWGQLKKNLEIWSSIMENTRSHTAQIIRGSTWDEPGSGDEQDSQTNNNKVRKNQNGIESEANTVSPATSLFLGFKFLPVGYLIPQQRVLKNVVESHHGELAESGDDDTITHILLLVKNGPQANLMLSALPGATKRRVHSKDIQVVTDWFIERSIFYNEVRHDNWSKPLQGLVPLATRYKVCVSGFTGVELLHIEKLVGFLNLEFCEVLNAKRDLLIININLFKTAFLKNSPELFEYKHKDILNCPIYSNGEASRSVAALSSKNKINAAKKWNIPVVSIVYLWEMIERLTGKSHLQMPDILDLAWCIFAPQAMARPKTLLDFVRKMSDNFSTQRKSDESKEEESVQLPSPRKSKDKQKYGRLAGGGESLTEKLKRARENSPDDSSTNKGWPDESFDEGATQVGYANQDSINSKQGLMKKLEGTSDKSKRLRRAR